MKIFCIPPEIADRLKEVARKGEFDIGKMYEMNSSQRRGLFEKHVSSDLASFINTEFEKAMVSNSVNALKKWAEKTFNVTQKKTGKYKDIISKIDSLNEMGLLTPKGETAFLEDLVASKLGVSLTTDEAKVIADKATKLQELKSKLTSIGDPTDNPQDQLGYFKARREMEDYLDSLNPSGRLRVLTSTISRGNMLMRLGSILVNINSNNIEGTSGAVVRRFEERAISGVNTKLLKDTIKFNAKVFRETGYDLTRIISLEADRKILGEEIGTSQGKGIIRKVGRWYEDKVFNLTQGLPDVMAASIAFGDRANIISTKIARNEKLKGQELKDRALTLFKDALNVEPKTEEGQEIRRIAVADAQRSTNTDKRFLADKALKFRKLLNVGDLRFGDMNIPFVKTTANAIQSGLEHSGVTLPIEAVVDTLKMVKLVQGGSGWGEASKSAFSGFGRAIIRAGMGFFTAWLIANAIDDEDYMGVYPTTQKERELLELKKATPNSIKIGNTWVSLDWFGALGAPLVGVLNAKKYGNTLANSVFFYGQGALYQVQRTPGLDYARQSLDSLNKFLVSTKETTVKEAKDSLTNYFVDFVQSRFIPGFISQIAQATDDIVRDTNRKNDILAPLKSSIPGLRQTLPPNLTVFGETTNTEGWKVLLFGARVKTGRDDKVIAELSRLDQAKQLPSITDVSKTSPRAKELKEQIGDKRFMEFQVDFGEKFKKDILVKINSGKYKRGSDEEKKEMIESLKSDLFEKKLKRYGYKKPKK